MTTLDHAIPAAEEQPWFYRIEDTADPWCHWFRMLRFPRHGPLDAEIEHDIEEVCRAADKRRLAIVPRTKRFAEMWATRGLLEVSPLSMAGVARGGIEGRSRARLGPGRSRRRRDPQQARRDDGRIRSRRR
jgi:hypothetical protein